MRKLASISILATALVAFAAAPAPAEMVKQGQAFPAWKLRDQTGAEVSSTDLAGKAYLLWFYPRAMTPGCTAEGDGLRDRHAEFQAAGIEVLGVSFDSPGQNAKFVAQESFPFRLLSDDGTLAVAVGAADVKDQAAARRISYLVGPDGKVRHAYSEVNPPEHAADVLADVESSSAPSSPH